MLAKPVAQSRTSARPRSQYLVRGPVWVLALACAADDVASGPSGERVRDGAAAPVPDDPTDAGGATLPAQPDAGACLPPRLVGISGQAVWSRNPETSDCCRYDDLILAPTSWPFFYTEAECQSSCRCSVLEDFSDDSEASGRYGTERTSLDCRCSAESCPSSLAEAERVMCNRGELSLPVARREGCGMVVIADDNGLFGDAWVFEQAFESTDAGASDARLIGAVQFGDVPSGPCQTYAWVAGRSFECDDVVECQLCGETTLGIAMAPCE